MKVLHISYSDIIGGAARATYRMHKALRSVGIDSKMIVNNSSSGDWTVLQPESLKEKIFIKVRPFIANILKKTLKTKNTNLISPSIFSSKWIKFINQSDYDIVHLHWVQREMLSISDFTKIKKPLIWTLHDMWAFCGSEHYTDDYRWKEGYKVGNRPFYERGFDLNRWTWKRKKRQWRFPFQIVTPSNWLANCVRNSFLLGNWDVKIIPYCLDLKNWKPFDKSKARELMGLPLEVPILLFGALDGGSDFRKGFDLLLDALIHLRNNIDGLELVVFGQQAPPTPIDLGFPVHYTGHLNDDISLRVLYSSADIMVIPSRQDNLPNTGIEAHSCGTPIAAFEIGGMTDIVDHLKTGYLAKPFDSKDLANGIKWMFQDKKRLHELGLAGRQKAEKCWSPTSVCSYYLELYHKILKENP